MSTMITTEMKIEDHYTTTCGCLQVDRLDWTRSVAVWILVIIMFFCGIEVGLVPVYTSILPAIHQNFLPSLVINCLSTCSFVIEMCAMVWSSLFRVWIL